MLQNQLFNNEVSLTGTIDSELRVSHEIYGEVFYNFVFKIPRLSDFFDYITITVSERLTEKTVMAYGTKLCVKGQFRSYNNYNINGNKILLTVFAKNLISDEIDTNDIQNPNYIYLNGYICKVPIYRITPFGREITDILLAVNRSYNKSDYIPCIVWGRNARFASHLNVGDKIKVTGRIQSREYQKKISEEEIISKTAYEVSVSKIEPISEQKINKNIG